jgi:antirestriction protein
MTDARVCFNDLADYNNGILRYTWFDLEDYADGEDLAEAVKAWLAERGPDHEEWDLADHEGFRGLNPGNLTFDEMCAFAALDEEDQIKVAAIVVGGNVCDFADALQTVDNWTTFESDKAFCDYLVETFIETHAIDETVQMYLDEDAIACALRQDYSIAEDDEGYIVVNM